MPCNVTNNKTMEPPENLPSVIKALFPNPAPIMAEVGLSISGIPGPPLGPQYLYDDISWFYFASTNSFYNIMFS
jgi:hypothetical protein